MKKISFLIPLWPLVFMCVGLFLFGRPSDFGVHKITHELPYCAEWVVEGCKTAYLAEILREPFHYVEKNGEGFVFESSDHHYRLQFFEMSQLTPSVAEKLFPFGSFKASRERKATKLATTFSSYRELFEKRPELLYVHLNATADFASSVELIDQENNRYFAPLDTTPFLLSERSPRL